MWPTAGFRRAVGFPRRRVDRWRIAVGKQCPIANNTRVDRVPLLAERGPLGALATLRQPMISKPYGVQAESINPVPPNPQFARPRHEWDCGTSRAERGTH